MFVICVWVKFFASPPKRRTTTIICNKSKPACSLLDVAITRSRRYKPKASAVGCTGLASGMDDHDSDTDESCISASGDEDDGGGDSHEHTLQVTSSTCDDDNGAVPEEFGVDTSQQCDAKTAHVSSQSRRQKPNSNQKAVKRAKEKQRPQGAPCAEEVSEPDPEPKQRLAEHTTEQRRRRRSTR